jgi:hypothetical protein
MSTQATACLKPAHGDSSYCQELDQEKSIGEDYSVISKDRHACDVGMGYA